MTPAWIAGGLTAAGLAALLVFAPMARAQTAPQAHRTWQLWTKAPGDMEWKPRAHPLGLSACKLDLADLLVKQPATRTACVHIQQLKVKQP